MSIRRNKDGQQNLSDLRLALSSRLDVHVYRQGGNWVISKWDGTVWHAGPCSYTYDERAAIQRALFGEIEGPEEIQYHARKGVEV